MAKSTKKVPKRAPGRPRREREVVRLTVYLPPAMKQWLAHCAVDNNCDMSEIVEAALDRYHRATLRGQVLEGMCTVPKKGGKK